jgi:hypothetical protein
MEPDELKIDANNPLASLGETPADGYVVAYEDGRVAKVRPAELAAALRGVGTNDKAANVAPAAEKPVSPQPRMWRDSKGRQLEATLVEVKDGKVTLRRKDNGKEISLPVGNLSQEDQQFLKPAAE